MYIYNVEVVCISNAHGPSPTKTPQRTRFRESSSLVVTQVAAHHMESMETQCTLQSVTVCQSSLNSQMRIHQPNNCNCTLTWANLSAEWLAAGFLSLGMSGLLKCSSSRIFFVENANSSTIKCTNWGASVGSDPVSVSRSVSLSRCFTVSGWGN